VTRRDLAAFRLAYESLRADCTARLPVVRLCWAFDALDLDQCAGARAVCDALVTAGIFKFGTGDETGQRINDTRVFQGKEWFRAARLLRARLALYLRAVLRVAAGRVGAKYYGYFCSACGTKQNYPDVCPWEGQGPGSCKCFTGCECKAPRVWREGYVRLRPFWESARRTADLSRAA
jgi:hypothetical protein